MGRLGGDAGLGQGARMMLDALGMGRVNVACRALGILDRCIACAIAECRDRRGANDALLLALARPAPSGRT